MEPPSVSNKDVQDSNPPSPNHLSLKIQYYRILRNKEAFIAPTQISKLIDKMGKRDENKVTLVSPTKGNDVPP